MNALFSFLIVIEVISSLVIIGLVLVQHGKGADMGAAFGSGASGSLFGASGSSNFLSKSTAIAAVVFFLSTMALAYVGVNRHAGSATGLADALPAAAPAPVTPAAPVAPAASADAKPAASAPAVSAPAASSK